MSLGDIFGSDTQNIDDDTRRELHKDLDAIIDNEKHGLVMIVLDRGKGDSAQYTFGNVNPMLAIPHLHLALHSLTQAAAEKGERHGE
jgi:hypothetical protein